MYKSILSFLNKHKGIVAILCLGIILRLIYFLIILHNFGSAGFYLTSNGDAVEYLTLAQQWLQNGTFQNLNGLPEPEVFRMPGYPLFIAFFYKIIPDVALSILFQNIIFLVSVAFFYKFSLLLFNRTVALLSCAFLALEPSMIYWNSQLITDTLFTVAMFFAIYFATIFHKDKKNYFPAISGLFFALAIFIRPAGEYLFGIFILFYFFLWLFKKINLRKLFLSTLIFIIAFLVPLMPLMVRNKYYFGSFEISNSSNIGFGKYLTAIYRQTGEEEDILPGKNPLENSAIVRKKTMGAILKHPLVFSKIYLLSLAPFFFGDAYLSAAGRIFPEIEKSRVITDWTGGTNEFFSFLKGHRGAEAFIFFFGKAVWTMILFFSAIGLVFWIFGYKKNMPTLILTLLVIFYFSLAAGIGSYSRFRFPANPYIFLLCALGMDWLIGFVAEKKKRKQIDIAPV